MDGKKNELGIRTDWKEGSGWEEGWVGKKDGLGRRIGWEEEWVEKKNGLGRSMG